MKIALRILIAGVILGMVSCSGKVPKQEAQDEEQFSFAFLTDIHIEPGQNAVAGFQQAIDSVNAHSPDFVITGGDLIADALGQPEELALGLYDLYIQQMKHFRMPLYNTLGNHEEFGIYERSGVDRTHRLYGHGMFEEKLGKRFYSFDHKGWRFYILDSVEETEDRQYYGHIDSVQLEWLEDDIQNLGKDIPVVIVSHIPFLTAHAQIQGGPMATNSRGLVVENAKVVLDLFRDYNLKLVLQGHIHHLEDIYIRNIHFITGGAVSAGWWKGPVNKTEEGFLLFRIKGGNISWEYVDYGWEV